MGKTRETPYRDNPRLHIPPVDIDRVRQVRPRPLALNTSVFPAAVLAPASCGTVQAWPCAGALDLAAAGGRRR